MTNVLAIDLGATSGRAILGIYENDKIRLQEISRFKNYVNYNDETITWDISKIMKEIYDAMVQAEKEYGFESIAVDTWGVDFGLIDSNDKLMREPVHYRDSRTEGILEKAKENISLRELYDESGIQIMEINTLFQLLHLKLYEKDVYDKTSTILLMPDLINFLLTNKKYAEVTIASTTQIFNPKTMRWNSKIIKQFDFKESLFPEIIPPGIEIGEIKESILNELNINSKKVLSIASHDTASAVLSVPSKDSNFTFLSSGTWSLFGQQLNSPIIDRNTFKLNIANEVGANNKITFLNNITGMWILEESKRYYKNYGKDFTYDEIKELTLKNKNNKTYIDVDDKCFIDPGNMPIKIMDYAKKTNQDIPSMPGEIFKVIYESLALKYKQTEHVISSASEQDNKELFIVGGGSKAELLCQMTADALNKKVIAGPSEATAMGNVMMQLLTLGKIFNSEHAKNILRSSDDVKDYYPINNTIWESKFIQYLEIIKDSNQ